MYQVAIPTADGAKCQHYGPILRHWAEVGGQVVTLILRLPVAKFRAIAPRVPVTTREDP